mgnify:CR=1 FL=1
MYAMKPILEPDVLDLLNNGRFAGEMEGYITADAEDVLDDSDDLEEEEYGFEFDDADEEF